jgi:hypothetical protein
MAVAESSAAGAGGEAPIDVTIVRLRAMGGEAGGPNVGPLVLTATEGEGLGGEESIFSATTTGAGTTGCMVAGRTLAGCGVWVYEATALEALREGAAADSAR